MHKYTFQIREIKQIRIPHIRTLARSHRHTLCERIPMLHQCTGYSTDHSCKDGIAGVTTTRCHSSAVLFYLAATDITDIHRSFMSHITQTDYNHECCFTDKRYILPRIRGFIYGKFQCLDVETPHEVSCCVRDWNVYDVCDQADATVLSHVD
jgi:hypothetical protein